MSTRTHKLITLVLTLLAGLALVAFAACGGGDDDDDSTNTPTATSESSGNGDDGGDDGDDGDATATDEPDGGDDGDDDDGGDGGSDNPLADIQNLTGDLDQVTGRVTYEVLDSDGDTSTMTFYSAPGKSRFDQGEGDDATSYITTEDSTYICTVSESSCLQYPGGGAGAGLGFGLATFFTGDTIAAYAAIAAAAGVDIDTSNESYAGIDAECFSWSDDGEDGIGTGKMCFGGDNGILLFEEFVDDGVTTTRFEATEVSEDVSDSDFEPPYPVMTIPGLPQ
jgi:hypothetical protein